MVNRRNRLVAGVLVLILATGFAGWRGWSWWSARHGDAAAVATARDDALRGGRQAISVLNTLDYRTADQGLRRWLDVSVGALHDELAQDREATMAKLAEGRTVTAGKVVDAAVTELSATRGTARVIVAVEITMTPEGGEKQVKRSRQLGDLVRTDSGWKLSALGQVPAV